MGDDVPAKELTLEEIIRIHTIGVITRLNGNKSLAAKLLGIDRRTLYRWLEKWKVK